MTFNIEKALRYLYAGTKNYYSCMNNTGTEQQQYDAFGWNSTTDPVTAKPTLEELKSAYIDFRRSELIEEIKNLKISKLEDAAVIYDSDEFGCGKDCQIFVHGAATNGDKTRTFYSKNKTAHLFTKTQAGELSGLITDCAQSYCDAEASLLSSVAIAADPDTVDINSGWPANPFT